VKPLCTLQLPCHPKRTRQPAQAIEQTGVSVYSAGAATVPGQGWLGALLLRTCPRCACRTDPCPARLPREAVRCADSARVRPGCSWPRGWELARRRRRIGQAPACARCALPSHPASCWLLAAAGGILGFATFGPDHANDVIFLGNLDPYH
jgi:hypothetical protein